MRRLILFASLVAAGSCVPAPPRSGGERTPLPTPYVAVPPPPAPPPADWRDRAATPGAWVYRRDERGSLALFGPPGEDASAVLRCDAANRRLFLSRAGSATGAFTIRTSSTTRQLPTGATGGTPPYAAATLPAGDPLLDAMAFSRGRFTLEQAGTDPLVLPAWAEVGRVIEDCRG